jgi:hypothetical protein
LVVAHLFRRRRGTSRLAYGHHDVFLINS